MIAALLGLTLGFTPDTTDTPDKVGYRSGLSGLSGVFPNVGHIRDGCRSVVCAASAQTTDTYDTPRQSRSLRPA
jgi:hypothetical protein